MIKIITNINHIIGITQILDTNKLFKSKIIIFVECRQVVAMNINYIKTFM